MEFEELEKRINDNSRKLDRLTEEIENNFMQIKGNKENIHKHSGTLEILKDLRTISISLFVIWILTFATLMYVIFK